MATIAGTTVLPSWYDGAGNLLQDGGPPDGVRTHTFQWDAENRLISVDGVAGQSCQPTWTACYAYNALGERVEKIGGGQTTYYYHDTSGNIAMNEITSLGQTHVHEYFFPTLAGRTYAKYYWTGSAWETDYLHGNPLGSTQVVTRSDNSFAEAEVFYPFGRVRWSGGGTQDVRFAGMQERDLETTTWQDPLDPTPNRLYTSGLGRWLTPDPAGKGAVHVEDPQTWNMYAYVRNNPTTLMDPTGLYLQNNGAMNALRAQLHASEAENEEECEQNREAGQATPTDQSDATRSQDDPPAAQNQTLTIQVFGDDGKTHDMSLPVGSQVLVATDKQSTDGVTGAVSKETTYQVNDVTEKGLSPAKNTEVTMTEKTSALHGCRNGCSNRSNPDDYKAASFVDVNTTGYQKSFQSTQQYHIGSAKSPALVLRQLGFGVYDAGRTVHVTATRTGVKTQLEP